MNSADQTWSFYADRKRPASAKGSESGNGRLCCSFEDLTEDEVVEEGWQNQAEKKRRLSSEQVKFLEHSFEMENRLEPDRKLLIAKHLSLQPRQVAVWFQNRRARSKTKQLEHDFDVLKASYDAISMENQKLQAEVASLNALLNGSNVTKPESSVQDKITSAPPAIDIYPKSNERITENAEGILFKFEVDSPTKSDHSEVSDCSGYIHESEASALRMIEDSDSAFCSNGLFESMHNPVLHHQDAGLKQEGDLFQEENCALIFNWEEHGFFSWYG